MKKDNSKLPILTHPDKILYPGSGITKQQIADYYISVQDYILPYLINRPLSLVRCPRNNQEKCFYQRHPNISNLPDLHTITIAEKAGQADYLYIKNLAGLLSLVKIDALEIHPWASTIKLLENPDMIIFDLDPAPDVTWDRVIKAAFDIKDHLEKIKLQSFLKTTGGKGLHIVIPIVPLYTWDEIKLFAKTVAQLLTKENPHSYIDVMTKAKRTGKIFIDYFRNERSATAIAPYSTRAHDNATIATPLRWEELTKNITSATFTVENFSQRLSHFSDPWKDFFKLKQELPF